MNITSSGPVTTTGRLTDGTVLTQSSALWADGRAPFFVMLYANKGSMLGTHTAHMATPAANLSWFKAGPSSTSDRTYAAGFAEIGLVSDGVRYVAQPGTVLALSAPPDNARLLFAEGGLASSAQVADLDQLLSISTTNVATLRTKTTGNPCLFTLKVTASTGLFSGTFTLTDGAIVRKAFYYGVLLPHRGAGEGFFTLRQLPNTAASPILSGSARLTGP